MGKNIFLIILAFVVVLTAAASIYMMIESNAVHSFMVRDYDRYMHDFAQNEYFKPYLEDYEAEPIENIKDAKRVAEMFFTEIYGESEKPYYVSYDEAEEVWHVSGTKLLLPMMGGFAEMLIHKDGTILAIWHGK